MPGRAGMPERGMDTGYGRKDVGRYKVQPYGSGYGPMRTAEPAPKPKPESESSSSGGGGGGGSGGGGGGASSGFDLDTERDNATDRMKDNIKKAEEVEPVEREVQPEDTVQGQIDMLLQKDSPYLQRARYAGEKMAQNRGLQNTSMAAQASEAAAIDAVLPIAAQDANTYFSQGINNQNTVNRFKENMQSLYQSLALGDQNLFNALTTGEQSFQHNSSLLGQELANRLEVARIQGLTSIFSTPGLTAAQQEHGASRLNSIFGHAPSSIYNYQY